MICKLLCCGGQLDVKCNNLSGDGACPTLVQAARLLRQKVQEQHGSEACLARAAQKVEEEGSGSSGQVESAFSVMRGAQLVRQRASSELKQAEEPSCEKSLAAPQSSFVAALGCCRSRMLRSSVGRCRLISIARRAGTALALEMEGPWQLWLHHA